MVGLPEASILVRDHPIGEVCANMARKGEWKVEQDRAKEKEWTMVSFLEDTKTRTVHYDLY